ncbi:hypothetical protein [Microbulbifer sp. 2205BS26-8]|uniref:SEL1-like repeat protein n=1 Tax=Microbulbifer sp. 2205BS26-8 TaxID=3064386 RepID=UPI00273F354A|nr:hypothetical protein [Microbulbifer sp. 2205BS26-8]MDP5209666.1 hypothetical protein [Microbulbifer sp. 2205BS26-8]
MKEVNPESQDLQIDVLNNLGYLKFFGYGIKENKEQAIEFWKRAISLGQYESEYHLCHAYAEPISPHKIELRLKSTTRAYLIYRGMEKVPESDAEILKQIKKYRAKI